MKSPKQFLQSVDAIKVSMVAESIKTKLSTDVDVETIVQEAAIEPYKRALLQEYIDSNKDKLLAMDTFNEGDAVVTSDDFAPHASRHGKVLTKGAVQGTYKVEFEDGEYDVPEHHLTRKDAVATEAVTATTHLKCFALLEDHSLVKIIVKTVEGAGELVQEHFNMPAIVVFEEDQSNLKLAHVVEGEMTAKQKAKREDIVMALKKNPDFKKKYGDKWEAVMYAVATKRAMEESSEEVLVRRKTRNMTVEIVRDGAYYKARKMNNDGEVVDVQEFSSMGDAENALMQWL